MTWFCDSKISKAQSLYANKYQSSHTLCAAAFLYGINLVFFKCWRSTLINKKV